MRKTRIFVLFQIVIFSTLTEQKALDDYIRHYEELSYDTSDLHERHIRAKRSTSDKSLSLKFKAHGRDFHLDLKPCKSIFTPDHKLRHNNGTEESIDTSFIYDGVVVGAPDSSVHGAVIQGIFRGVVRIPGDTNYHIESAHRFFGRQQNKDFHSVIYKEEHINLDPYRHKRGPSNFPGTCANDEHLQWMQKVSESAVPQNRAMRTEYEDGYHNKYSAEANEYSHRQKRSTGSCNIGTKNTCYLYLRSDPLLFNKLKEGVGDIAARDEIIAFFASHVDAISKIYRNTVFETYNSAGSPPCYTNIQFEVKRTSIMTDETENCNNQLQKSSFCNPNIDVSNFLNLNSLQNHSDFCLAYIFTYRDFTQGTLGLAWVGSPSRNAGGICEKWKQYTEGSQQVYKSLNTGIVTIVNYGKRVAPRVSQLTFAHEVGHNFGSPHDSGQQCAPYGTSQPNANQGNYIMFASATQGNREHNDEFSVCSKDNMTRVIQAVTGQSNGKVNCFEVSGQASCGNGIVEDGEECDCGYEEDCTDTCCNPKITGQDRSIDCKLKADAQCSPTAGPCCTSSCNFVTSTANKLCRAATDCMQSQNCEYPLYVHYSITQSNYTLCNSKSQVCLSGFCSGSLCQAIGHLDSNGNVISSSREEKWEDCYINIAGQLTVKQKEELCLLACQIKTNGTCITSKSNDLSTYPEFNNVVTAAADGQEGVKLPAGSPCNDYQGYCDVFHRCRGVDNEGPLQRLKNLLFSEETFTTIKNWIIEHWWAVMLMAIGLILAMGLFIKFCAVHTPSSNPNAKPALRLTDTLRRRRRPPPQQNYMPGPSEPPPPYSAPGKGKGGPPPGHRKDRQGKNRQTDYEMRRKV
ncbi:hypothetical protein FSP39_001269 [Pinctada imbricata]|uniref:ADAM10 endopeptidase n=1 Tax=Pinctada imbricata TaxID=66713 RepID=A0AA88YDA8_PINIB|nr:hypothetical protein FSP39_001269 [Pinctada imbricata]